MSNTKYPTRLNHNLQLPKEPKWHGKWPAYSNIQLYRDTWWYCRKPFHQNSHMCAGNGIKDLGNSGLLETALLTDDIRQIYMTRKETTQKLHEDYAKPQSLLFNMNHGMKIPKWCRSSPSGDVIVLDWLRKQIYAYNGFSVLCFSIVLSELQNHDSNFYCVTSMTCSSSYIFTSVIHRIQDHIANDSNFAPSFTLPSTTSMSFITVHEKKEENKAMCRINLPKRCEALCFNHNIDELIVALEGDYLCRLDGKRDFQLLSKHRYKLKPCPDNTQLILAPFGDIQSRVLITRVGHPYLTCLHLIPRSSISDRGTSPTNVVFIVEMRSPYDGLALYPTDITCYVASNDETTSDEIYSSVDALSLSELEKKTKVVVADGLNQLVIEIQICNAMTTNVVLLPKDELRCVNSVCVTKEGHLAVTECSVSEGLLRKLDSHEMSNDAANIDSKSSRLKIFRFQPCICHSLERRPGKTRKGDDDEVLPHEEDEQYGDWLIETKAVVKFVPQWLKALYNLYDSKIDDHRSSSAASKRSASETRLRPSSQLTLK